LLQFSLLGKRFCIITATAPATLAVATVAALTPDYEVLTNQGDAPVSVYIDSVALQLNLSHHSNEHRILYVLRALNTTPLCHLSDTNKIKSFNTLIPEASFREPIQGSSYHLYTINS
jgi:hypothetical protein